MQTSECPDCGQPTDEQGVAKGVCNWTKVDCETCQHCYCDGSC